MGDLLAEAALHDLDHYLAFPWAQRIEAHPERTQGLFILAPSTIASEAEVDRIDQVLITERLGQELNGTALHRLYRHRDVAVARYEDDRDLDIRRGELALKIQTAPPRQSDVQDEAGGTVRAVGVGKSGTDANSRASTPTDRKSRPTDSRNAGSSSITETR